MCKSIVGDKAQFAEAIFLIKHQKNQAQKQGSANQWGATAAEGEVAIRVYGVITNACEYRKESQM